MADLCTAEVKESRTVEEIVAQIRESPASTRDLLRGITDELVGKVVEELGISSLFNQAVWGEELDLEKQEKTDLRILEELLEVRYARITGALSETANPEQREKIKKLNNIHQASNQIRRKLGMGIIGPEGREKRAVLATGAPLPSKGER